MKTSLFYSILSATATLVSSSLIHRHEITSIPNYNDSKPINFKQYAGQMELPTSEKLFYWFVESENDPQHDPLVLWLNGGPGCSSLGGFFTENGPYIVQSDLSVRRNAYAWNRKANMVYLESPAGVGFSTPFQNDYNDNITTDRAYSFLEKFIEEYSEFQNRSFYITGESYAGIYIPYLVNKLVNEPIPGANLTGFAIGNPFTDNTIDTNAYFEYFYTHGMISLESYKGLNKYCDVPNCLYTPTNCSADCQVFLNEALDAVDSDNLNPYFIYGDICLLKNGQGQSLHHHSTPSSLQRGPIEPCTDKFTEAYLRLPQVQKAINVESNETVQWSNCNENVGVKYVRSETALPFYKNILSKNMTALIYSGDADSVVNFIGTERWIGEEGLNLSVVTKWKSWFGPDHQVAGYVEEYNGLTFKTVKGAGHMVPATRPLHGLYMFECFLYGQDRCDEFKYPADDFEYLTGDVIEDDGFTNSSANATTSDDATITYLAKPKSVSSFSYTVPLLLVGVAGVVAGTVVLKRSQRQRHYIKL